MILINTGKLDMSQIIVDPSKKPSRVISLLKYLFIMMSVVGGILFAILAGAANPTFNAYLDDPNRTWSESIGSKQVSSLFKIPIEQAQTFPNSFKLSGNLHKPKIENVSALSLVTVAGSAY